MSKHRKKIKGTRRHHVDPNGFAKHGFKKRSEARKAANRNNMKYYRCPYCNEYHLAKRKSRK